MVHDLAERGLLDTVRMPPDRRVVRVGVTKQGSRVVRAALASQREALAKLAQDFDAPGVGDMLQQAVQLYLGVDISAELGAAQRLG